MTRDETRFLLHRLCTAYGRRAPDQATVDEWQRGLEKVRVNCAHAALDALIQEGNAGPNLAVLVARARALDDTRRPVYVPDKWDGPNESGRSAIRDLKRKLQQMRDPF